MDTDSDLDSFEDPLDSGAANQWVVAEDVEDYPAAQPSYHNAFERSFLSTDYVHNFVNIIPRGQSLANVSQASSSEDSSFRSDSSQLRLQKQVYSDKHLSLTAKESSRGLYSSTDGADNTNNSRVDETETVFLKSEAVTRTSMLVAQNFESIKLIVHPSRVAVHPHTGQKYHIADFMLLFPDLNYLSYSSSDSRVANQPRKDSLPSNNMHGVSRTYQKDPNTNIDKNASLVKLYKSEEIPLQEKYTTHGAEPLSKVNVEPLNQHHSKAYLSPQKSIIAKQTTSFAKKAHKANADENHEVIRVHAVNRSTRDIHGMHFSSSSTHMINSDMHNFAFFMIGN